MNASATLIALSGLRKSYNLGRPNEAEVLHGLDLHLARGEFVALIGPSGSGKSTLLNILGLLERPTDGSYRLLDQETATLDDQEVEAAIDAVLEQIGYRSTNYGRAFEDFEEHFLDSIDRHTTVIIMGDGRSNNTDPRADILRLIHDRAKRVIWLNPEPRAFWGTGDSEMPALLPAVHLAKTVTTVRHLERLMDDLLEHAAHGR